MGCRGLLSAFFCVLCLALTGCTSGTLAPSTTPTANTRASGNVFGGQQPVVGASIQLYTVGTTADGSAATPLLTQTVNSDATGSFTITGLYSCTNATQVYIVATGGNPGLSTTNPNIALMAALGPCSSLSPSTFININELTTVAGVSALAPYMTSASAVGSSSSEASSLANAFTLANQLVNTATGTAPGTNVPSGYTVPTTQLNTLADIAASCINSTGGTAGDGSLCGTLFSLTTVAPNPAPTNTITALLNLSNNPTLNTSALFALTPPTPPFQPTLTSVPANWQIQLIQPAGTGLQISPSSITFPDTAVGSISHPQTVTVQNTGASLISLSDLSFGGVNGQDFSIVNPTCGQLLNAGSSCTVQVQASPLALGARTGVFVIQSSATNSPQFVSLSVNGINPAPPPAGSITLTSSLNFTILGALQDLTLSNASNTPLTITSITESDSGPANNPYFKITANNCGTSLPAQSVCTITVASTNSPNGSNGPATYTGTITVTDNAASGPQTASITSTDTVISAPGIITFPANQVGYTQTSANATAYGRWAPGANPPSPVPLTISGTNASDFSISTQDSASPSTPKTGCYGTYNIPGNVCNITVSFTPSASGLRTAKVSLDSPNANSTGQYMLLQGTGIGSGPSFRVDTTSVTAGNSLPGNLDPNSASPSQPITLTNTGTTTVNLTASFTGSAAPYLSVSAMGCNSVAPQATCQFTVSFNSPTAGNYSGTVVLKDANSTFSLSVPFTGVTNYWMPVAKPDYLSFGNQPIGTISTAQTFTIADPYGYPLGHAYTVTLQPSSSFVLTQGSTCPASTTQICTLAIAFAPLATGTANEYATITDQTTGIQSQLNIVGTGGGPSYALSSNNVTFPTRTVGTTSIPTVIALTSNGTQTLSVSKISITGAVNNNFTQTNNCSSVPVNSTCSINITFAPTAAGTQSATLQITSDALNSPSTISLSGTAQ